MVSINAFCVECGDEFNPKRKALGYKLCLECGEQVASAQAKRKAMCTAPAYNKGAYMYITNHSMAKEVGK